MGTGTAGGEAVGRPVGPGMNPMGAVRPSDGNRSHENGLSVPPDSARGNQGLPELSLLDVLGPLLPL